MKGPDDDNSKPATDDNSKVPSKVLSGSVARLEIGKGIQGHLSIPQIHNLASVDKYLIQIAQSIFNSVGSQNYESLYENCLVHDLRLAELKVESQVSMELIYKGNVVGHRFADIVITTKNGERAVLELKAVDTVSPQHMKQLHYYMEALDINQGYLVNFPHDDGFPCVDKQNDFQSQVLSGDPCLINATNYRNLRLRHSGDAVQIVKVLRRRLSMQEMVQKEVSARQQAATSSACMTQQGNPCKTMAPKEVSARQQAAARPFCPRYAMTQLGNPCKICIKRGGHQYCTVASHRNSPIFC